MVLAVSYMSDLLEREMRVQEKRVSANQPTTSTHVITEVCTSAKCMNCSYFFFFQYSCASVRDKPLLE